MWTEMEGEGVREEMVWEKEKTAMEGDHILQVDQRHQWVMAWAIKHWKNSLGKTLL